MAPIGASGRVRFGGFEFDPATRELRKGRTRLRAPDQSLVILAMLLERPGELVAREAIQARLWPNGTIVEFDQSVNAAIRRLRQALSDTADQPRYIETLPRQGYRFLAAVEAVAPSKAIPDYRMLEEIGRGAMGVVYRAEDLRLGRAVALKVLPPELASDPQRKARLIREARAASALNHPNIVTVYDIGSEDGRDYIVMEYVAGKPLSEVIPRHGLPAKEAVRIAIQMADALARAHAAGIVHRDLKPGNFMLTGEGQLKLLDFGLAKITDPGQPETSHTQTLEGEVMGTAGYMSPEQAEGKLADARSDIFSFGSVLYEMVTGRQAFHGRTPVETLATILHNEPLPPSRLVSGLPPALEAVILRCVAKEPGARFQRMDEVKAALEKMESAAPAVAPHRLRRALAIASIAGIVLAAAAAWIGWLRPEPAPADLHPVPLMAWPGRTYSPSFSPDGNKLAFSWNGEKQNTFHVYVEQIGSGTPPIQLTNGPANDRCPAWSPDDRYIAFTRDAGSGRALMLVPPLGGPERKIAEFPGFPCNLAWTPDSRWVALPAKDAPNVPNAIWLISVETGERRQLTKPSASGVGPGDMSPCISPDGRVLVFGRELRSYVSAPYALRLSRDFRPEGEPRELTSERYARIVGLAFTADSRAVVYSGGNSTVNSLYRLPVSGRHAPSRLPYVPPGSLYPTISLSRSRLAYVSGNTQVNLWRLDTRSGERKMLVGSNRIQHLPQYSPDGRKIAFDSDRSGEGAIWTCDGDGSNCQELASFGSTQGGASAWSPDGRWIAFDSRVEGRSQIYVVQADGGLQRRVTNGPADDYAPSWSRDGHWIYFASNRSGRGENWKIPAAGGTAVQVTRAGGGFTFESADGEDLYFSKLSVENSWAPLFRMPVRGGAETQIAPQAAQIGGFCVTAKAVYFTPDFKTIQRLDLSSGRTTTVATVERWSEGLTVSPDEAFVVWPQLDQIRAELMLVEGFR
jgi:serine/threonine protein kinase